MMDRELGRPRAKPPPKGSAKGVIQRAIGSFLYNMPSKKRASREQAASKTPPTAPCSARVIAAPRSDDSGSDSGSDNGGIRWLGAPSDPQHLYLGNKELWWLKPQVDQRFRIIAD